MELILEVVLTSDKTVSVGIVPGLRMFKGFFRPKDQEILAEIVRDIVREAPLYTPQMPRTGKPLSVRMTNCGKLGWLTDKNHGYRYQAHHPQTGRSWPEVPEVLTDLWTKVADYPLKPEACLINYYDQTAKMGLHQDSDEKNFDAPVVSVSLGDACLFRIGGTSRKDKTQSFRLESGDVLVMGGGARMRFHGVDRIYSGTSGLLKNGGRINLTLRRVNR